MRIVFLPGNCLPFHGNTLLERPLGGTETGIIRLSESLKNLGHEVFVVSMFENPPLTDPLYIPLKSVFFLGEIDLLVCVRDWQNIFTDIKAKKKFLWTGDAFDQPLTIGIGDRRIASQLDGLLCVSEWQKETLAGLSGFPIEKTFVIRNGVNTSLFPKEKRRNNRTRMIYSSTPYRGLTYLGEILRGVQQTVPEASLCVCSGYTVYEGTHGIPQSQLDDLAKIRVELEPLPGVTWKGNILQKDLAEEMLQSGIYAYPCIFAETSCISVLEAKAAGVVPVTNALGALPEAVGEGGIVIPSKDNFNRNDLTFFIEAICSVMKDQSQFQALSEIGIIESSQNTWNSVAQRLLAI